MQHIFAKLIVSGIIAFSLAGALSYPAYAQGSPLSLDPNKAPVGNAKQAAAAVPKLTVDRVNDYFNGLTGLTADFIQTAPDGRRYDGKLHLLRPGKLRFEYKPPSPLEIVADGRSVAVRDRKLNTQDLYLIGQTPLKFLLQQEIDVARDLKVVSLTQKGNDAIVVLDDKSTLGGTSRIRLVFNNADMALRQWTVTDPQGQNTMVQLANIDTSKRPSASLFRIQEGRVDAPR